MKAASDDVDTTRRSRHERRLLRRHDLRECGALSEVSPACVSLRNADVVEGPRARPSVSPWPCSYSGVVLSRQQNITIHKYGQPVLDAFCDPQPLKALFSRTLTVRLHYHMTKINYV